MRTEIRKIGNSQGIIIPKPFIDECHFGRTIEMSIENNALVLRASPGRPRAGWAEAFAKYGKEPDQEMLEWQALENDADKEWEW